MRVWASIVTTFLRTFFQSSFRAVSEQFQSSFRAVSEQFQTNFRAVSEQFFSRSLGYGNFFLVSACLSLDRHYLFTHYFQSSFRALWYCYWIISMIIIIELNFQGIFFRLLEEVGIDEAGPTPTAAIHHLRPWWIVLRHQPILSAHFSLKGIHLTRFCDWLHYLRDLVDRSCPVQYSADARQEDFFQLLFLEWIENNDPRRWPLNEWIPEGLNAGCPYISSIWKACQRQESFCKTRLFCLKDPSWLFFHFIIFFLYFSGQKTRKSWCNQ